MKILVADDDQVIRTTLEKVLTTNWSNNKVEFAIDGQDAANKAKETQYDLILLDLDMPKLTGYEVLTEIRKSDDQVPVVFITGTGESKKVTKSIAQLHLNGFIEKPFTPEQVKLVVEKVTRQQKPELR
jgi:CheY-like chemotaxis protein